MNQRFSLFNSPLETSLRTLFILQKIYPKSIDTQRLIYYLYLSLHTKDFSSDLESLHPPIPHRSCQIIIQRKVLQESIHLLEAKDLVVTKYLKSGICYKAHKNANKFIEYFQGNYANKLSKRVNAVIDRFSKMTDIQIDKFMEENLTRWGSEFIEEEIKSK